MNSTEKRLFIQNNQFQVQYFTFSICNSLFQVRNEVLFALWFQFGKLFRHIENFHFIDISRRGCYLSIIYILIQRKFCDDGQLGLMCSQMNLKHLYVRHSVVQSRTALVTQRRRTVESAVLSFLFSSSHINMTISLSKAPNSKIWRENEGFRNNVILLIDEVIR